MPTLTAYRNQLGWSQVKLAMEAGLDPQVIARAENGEPITQRSAILLAQALSRALDTVIMAYHLDGLNIKR